MVVATPPASSSPSLAVSTPGGLARQYRVQVFDRSDGYWHLYRSFRTRCLALGSLQELQGRGLLARLVAYTICASSH